MAVVLIKLFPLAQGNPYSKIGLLVHSMVPTVLQVATMEAINILGLQREKGIITVVVVQVPRIRAQTIKYRHQIQEINIPIQRMTALN